MKEKLVGKNISVLDHGFIRVVDIMGDDAAIVQAARVSYGAGTKQRREDKALIRYLLRHNHSTPFEMCEIKLHVKMPIFVARQWIRHRTANVNEYSARYSILGGDFYIPDLHAISMQSQFNKQGRDENFAEDAALQIQEIIRSQSETAYSKYNQMIEMGVSREIARIILPTNIYTEMYWKCDLRNFMNFLKLRSHHGAQYEIRQYADAMLKILQEWMPDVYEAFVDYQLDAVVVSKQVKELLKRRDVSEEDADLGKTEWADFVKNFD